MQVRTHFFAAAILLLSTAAFSQSLKKIPISHSGCSIYTYCDMKIDESKSPDSSLVFAGECTKEDISWGVICVKLINQTADLVQAEELLVAYLDFLRSSFAITRSAGYGRGHRLNKNEDTRGVLDYWEDAEKNHWKVKGWTNGKFIGVMYVYSKKDLPEQKVNIFLDGFRMPER